VDRFWEKVDIKGPDDCWPWLAGSEKPSGYGHFWFEKRTIQAHRMSYALSNDVDIYSLDVVRHTCDNGPCCNPAHLVHGTQGDNMRDKAERARAPRGVRHHKNKLTEDDVREIRKRLDAGEYQHVIGSDYGISQMSVSYIKQGTNWGWLE
jgi:hypothetical protein